MTQGQMFNIKSIVLIFVN